MAVVRDPAFWKRFSTAIHLDEEGGYTAKPELKDLKDSDGWLAKQRRKQQRRRYVCLWFWLSFGLFVGAVFAVVIWLLNSGILKNVHLGNGSGTPSQTVVLNEATNDKVRRLVEMVVR
ncbi:hypothetical protein LTR17_004191 [Elasticomyces elasticus]|nr:hypothetical protein LTR17_004191 [Elasticomyces elasticus]